ncbi:uncharacterized protein [Chelonus insularis]|uniref:uncharacterized protein n=1 Tax=Chelonus insularis TaxID=460826 RepID=UPI00158927E3|nr:uncharacterized protein LOC118073374 [Chelonus insularis]
MATDVEESDTEDHERPVPPKRQCINVVNNTEDQNHQVHQSIQQDLSSTGASNDVLAREKFQRFQNEIDKHCYMGSVDNTINQVMETYILKPPTERAHLRLFRELEMEDTAVTMAIRNHGLVHSTEFVPRSRFRKNSLNHWSSDDDVHFPTVANYSTDVSSKSNDSNSTQACATTSKICSPRTFQQLDETIKHNWSVNKPEDGDEQDILERAVAEAIKIKGLSALSVDYG